ncbi:serine hydrolase [Microbulbifer halophilus]|uniref:Serine hydrolase n=2 Tax=Microbulbifer halophilus TaxID=453963 RepID=A0ABW5E5H2_9GAMM|nr:serine hydrolase [Microbulbifer halophilus]MCW8127462.1 serine hydrolase [Microbulbifer halophilus]
MILERVIGFALTWAVGLSAQAADWRAEVTDFGERLVALRAVPGMGIAVIRGDRIVHQRSFGIADANTGRTVNNDTYFYIASSTKALTASAVALRAARGELDLDAPLVDYLPELEGATWDAQGVTLDELLAMRHGMEDRWPIVLRTAYSGDFTRAKLVALLKDYQPSENGKTFDYNNLGYNLLGLVLGREGVHGWKRAVEAEVLAPLGMAQTTAQVSELAEERIALPHNLATATISRIPLLKADANLHAAGGHFSTASSLARFVAAHIAGGNMEGERFLPEAPLLLTQQRHSRQDRQFGDYHRTGWGYGWDIGDYEGEPLLHRFGAFSGYRTHMSFMPERDIGVVVLANATTPAVDLMANYIYEWLLDRDEVTKRFAHRLKDMKQRLAAYRERYAKHLRERKQRASLPNHPLEAYAGIYENNELGTMEWRLGEEGLEVRLGVAHSSAEIYDAGDNAFRIEVNGGGSVAHFLVDESGDVSGVRFLEREFTRRP